MEIDYRLWSEIDYRLWSKIVIKAKDSLFLSPINKNKKKTESIIPISHKKCGTRAEPMNDHINPVP